MLRKIFKLVGVLLLVLIVGIGSFYVFAMYKIRKLPWQKSVFETIKPADPGTIGEQGILVFSKTNGFRHESIEEGVAALKQIGTTKGYKVVQTENGAFFNDDYLSRFKVVVFLSTTGDILTPDQQTSFEKYIENGGGYVGIHAASDTEYDWKWYDSAIGTHFKNHSLFPHIPEATLITESRTHHSTKHLQNKWRKADEWYNFVKSVRGVDSIQVLVSVDEKSYDVGETKGMGGDHPISWTNKVGNGRIFYTALGHNSETFRNEASLNHIWAGVEWAAKLDGK